MAALITRSRIHIRTQLFINTHSMLIFKVHVRIVHMYVFYTYTYTCAEQTVTHFGQCTFSVLYSIINMLSFSMEIFDCATFVMGGWNKSTHTHAHNKLYGRSCMCIRSGTHVNAFSGLFRLKANNGSKAAAVSEGTNKLVLDRDGVCLMRRRVWSKDVKRRAILVRKIWNEINFSPKEINEQVRGEANTCTIWCVCPFVRQCLHSVVGVVKVKIWEN